MNKMHKATSIYCSALKSQIAHNIVLDFLLRYINIKLIEHNFGPHLFVWMIFFLLAEFTSLS